jgi:hypothetical protein
MKGIIVYTYSSQTTKVLDVGLVSSERYQYFKEEEEISVGSSLLTTTFSPTKPVNAMEGPTDNRRREPACEPT